MYSNQRHDLGIEDTSLTQKVQAPDAGLTCNGA